MGRGRCGGCWIWGIWRIEGFLITEGCAMPKVLNKYKEGFPAGSVYIGRPSAFGNPFVIGKDGTREEVIAKHREWLLSQPQLIERAKKELRGKDLVCFCAPKACHGDLLLRIANEDDSD
jgi:hypothetical protein